MRVKKWLMKQQWRVIQIRGIWSLFYGVLLLAYAYFEYIPFFSDLAFYGPFVFAGFILLVFLIFGYIYDKVLMMWAPTHEVAAERNPYQYVPSTKDHIFWFPVYSTLLDVVEQLARQNEVDTSAIANAREYYSEIAKLRPERKEDIDKSIELRERFIGEHNFNDAVRS